MMRHSLSWQEGEDMYTARVREVEGEGEGEGEMGMVMG
jgi:hypothetical protein